MHAVIFCMHSYNYIDKMKKKSLLFIALMFVAACNQVSEEHHVGGQVADSSHIIDPSYILDNKIVSYKEDMVSEMKLVHLETSDESIVSYIMSITVTPDAFFVLHAAKRTTLSIFDKYGKFIRTIPCGQGPEDLLAVTSLYYDNESETVFAVDQGNRKISQFNKTGDFVKNYYYPDDLIVYHLAYSDGKFVFIQNGASQMDRNFRVITTDTLFSEYDTWTLGAEPFNVGLPKYITKAGDGFDIIRYFDNHIYYYKDGVIEKKYKFVDRRDKYKLEGCKEAVDFYNQMFNTGDYICPGPHLETKDFLYTSFDYTLLTKRFVLINKNTGCQKLEEVKDHSFMCYAMISGVADFDSNEFYAIVQPEYLKGEQYPWDGSNPNDLISQDDMEMLSKVTPDDNPIIALIKFKQD